MTIFGASSLHPKIPFPAAVVECEVRPRLQPLFGILDPRYSYSGLSPSASNCRLHSVGGSRRRSIPTPRGRRPSTAALTRLGARKASEMVMLTCRALFDVGRRNAGDRSCCRGLCLAMQDRRRGVIAIANAGLCSVGWNHSMAGIVKEQ